MFHMLKMSWHHANGTDLKPESDSGRYGAEPLLPSPIGHGLDATLAEGRTEVFLGPFPALESHDTTAY